MNLKNEIVRDYIMFTIGTIILACTIGLFFEKNHMVIGGLSGLSIVIQYVMVNNTNFFMEVSTIYLILNIPVFIFGFTVRGKKFMLKTIYGTLLLTFLLRIVEGLSNPEIIRIDMINVYIYAGILEGIVLGLIFKYRGTTGGTDLIASILNKVFKGVPVENWMFLCDGTVILTGLLIFGINASMYALMVIFIANRVVKVVYKINAFNKSITVISDKSDVVYKELIKEKIVAISMKSNELSDKKEKNIIIFIIEAKQINRISEVIADIDENAIVIVNDAEDVRGNGFSPLKTIY